MFLPSPHILEFFPEYRSTQTPWQGLTPVAAWLVRDLGPARIVELGSYRGDSFFAFLQAAAHDERIKDLVAVDSWEGDQHTGSYGSTVHRQFMTELNRRGDPRARAIRCYFAEAVAQFEQGSIDLLHIDGAHDYESVRVDFETWLPKMSQNGVILFHDTMVRDKDFGVWRLWAELELNYPSRTFNFEHSNGLGILCLGQDVGGQVRAFGGLPPPEAALVRDALRIAGHRVTSLTSYEYGLLARNGVAILDDHVFSRGDARQSIEALSRMEALQDDTRIAHILDSRIERLFRDQAGDVFSALRPMLEEYGRDLLSGLVRELPVHIRDMTKVKNDAQDDAIMSVGEKIDVHEVAIQELASYLRQIFQHPLFRGEQP